MIKQLRENSEYDLNNDGTVSDDELHKSTDLLELELREEKAQAQKLISWVALVSMIIVTCVLLSPLVSDARVSALDNLIGMFYLACASIIGFYFGATAYMSKS
jgi:hypothetical protein